MSDDVKKTVVAPSSGDEPKKAATAKEEAPEKTPTLKDILQSRYLDNFTFSTSAAPYLSTLGDLIKPNWGSLKDDDLRFSVQDTKLFSGYEQFGKQLTELQQKFSAQAKALGEAEAGSKEQRGQIDSLKGTIKELTAKEQLGFLLSRVNSEAQRALLESEPFRQKFLEQRECNAIVMSVDIRRSTELMLKARKPQDFALFTIALCTELTRIIIDANGVFDKFTGDGVLAFFPDFYSGKDAAYRAIAAADRCHDAFSRHYNDSRKLFTSVLKDVGLGIGIDYGTVRLVQVGGGLTVVGVPVVYACRLSGEPAGVTFVNQPAYDVISERYSQYCFLAERDLEIKHEGRMVTYEVRLNGKEFAPATPDWLASK